MAVAQPATQTMGRIIFGVTLPCIRIKIGHLECLSILRGPCCNQLAQISKKETVTLATSYRSTYEVTVQLARVLSVQVELTVARGRQVLHKCRSRGEPFNGVLLLQAMRLALGVVVAMGSYIGWHRGSGVVTRGCWGCIVGWCRMPVGHLE